MSDIVERLNGEITLIHDAAAEISRLREALKRYGRHDGVCDIYRNLLPPEAPCDCGFSEALGEVK